MRIRLVIFLTVLSLLFNCAICVNALGNQKIQVTIGSHEIGTGAHYVSALITESIMEVFPDISVRVLPSTNEVARAFLGRLGDVDVILENNLTGPMLQNGTELYSTWEWGPQEFGYVFSAPHVGMVLGTRGDKGIQDWEDLKGKTVCRYNAMPVCDLLMDAFLAYGGLTWDDVVIVEYANPGQSYQAVVDGRLDASFFNISGSSAYELVALPIGYNFLPMSLSNTDAWKKVRELSPALYGRISTMGAGASVENPLTTLSCGYPSFFAWNTAESDNVYNFLKAFLESEDSWKSKDEALKQDYTLENSWNIWDNDVIPMHPGAIKYYKEIGEWNDEREKLNQERIGFQNKIKALWEEARETALEQNIPAQDFANFWQEIIEREKVNIYN